MSHSTASVSVSGSDTLHAQRALFCGVCKNAGKPREVCIGHCVSLDASGAQICPTVAGFECRYCHDLGHTIRHCPKLSNQRVTEGPPARPQRPNKPRPEVDESGFTTVEVKRRRDAGPCISTTDNTLRMGGGGAYAIFNDSAGPKELHTKPKLEIMGPKPCEAQKPVAACWGGKKAAVLNEFTKAIQQAERPAVFCLERDAVAHGADSWDDWGSEEPAPQVSQVIRDSWEEEEELVAAFKANKK